VREGALAEVARVERANTPSEQLRLRLHPLRADSRSGASGPPARAIGCRRLVTPSVGLAAVGPGLRPGRGHEDSHGQQEGGVGCARV
jgi:hypothetical protein